MRPNKLLFIIGTRPELIKIFPVVNELKKRGNTNFKILATGQHKSLLDQYWKLFDIRPDYELDVMVKGQDLAELTAKTILQINNLLTDIEVDSKPDYIIGQGDTTTVMVASMVAFYNNIQYVHIEAGLRSFDLGHPFPEEYNRKLASIATEIHFAPTILAKNNLLKEGVSENKIEVVGNTVIDALHFFIKNGQLRKHKFTEKTLHQIKGDCVLITCHRRENHNLLDNLIYAVKELAGKYPETTFVWSLHPNPKVYNYVLNSTVSQIENVLLVKPLEYLDLLKVISKSRIILTDSGGIQEEAPTFRVPLLILRDKTERPEAVDVGVSRLVGMDSDRIIEEFINFNPIFNDDFQNPYGDGKASIRILDKIFYNEIKNK